MDGSAHISETRQGLILRELAALHLELARNLQQRALAAETTDEAVEAATAFHKVGRGLRQTLALENKLGRDTELHDRDLARHRQLQRKDAVERRKTHLYVALDRMIWDEVEHEDLGHELRDDLREFLNDDAELETFLELSVDHQIAQLRRRLGLDEPRGEEGEDPPAERQRPAPRESRWNLPDDDVADEKDDAWPNLAEADTS